MPDEDVRSVPYQPPPKAETGAPKLSWQRGEGLEAPTPAAPLYIQERIHPSDFVRGLLKDHDSGDGQTSRSAARAAATALCSTRGAVSTTASSTPSPVAASSTRGSRGGWAGRTTGFPEGRRSPQLEAVPWGSRSTMTVESPSAAAAHAVATESVVLPVPPFCAKDGDDFHACGLVRLRNSRAGYLPASRRPSVLLFACGKYRSVRGRELPG